MVCKEDVVTWFKDLTGHKRIDLMCSLFNMCLPFELRFLGTCLEDLGKRDFHDMRDAENKANSSSELAELQCLNNTLVRRKLALYLSLLHSCNQACTNGLYKILANFDFGEINTLISNISPEENPLDELLLLYTLAINHPAFTYEQKTVFGSILVKLQDEENKLYVAKHPVGIGLVYVKPPMQPCVPCPSPDERQQQDVGVLGHCSTMSLPPSHPAGDMKGRSLPPGLTIPPGLGLPPDQQLTATSYVHVTFPSPGHQPLPSVPWHGGVGPLMMTSLCGTLPPGEEVQPYPSSPMMSRQSSPSQSGSPSRAGSPARMQQQQQAVGGQGFKGPPPPSSTRRGERLRQNCVDTSVAPPLQQRSVSRKSSVEPGDPLRETLGKEMPNYVPNLQNYSAEELRRMSEEELKELGLTPGAIHQLRSIVAKLHATNGMSSLDKRELVRRKQDSADNEVSERKTQSAGPVMRRYEGPPVMYPPPPLMSVTAAGPCYTCIAVPVSSATAPARYPPQGQAQLYCVNHNMRALRLDGSHSSSASDSSSAGHSPPDTPSIATAPHWERGYPNKETNVGERWSPGCEERMDKERRLPEPGEKPAGLEESNSLSQQQQQQTMHNNAMSNNNNNRPRLPAGLGRNKSNPPGLQTMARGRGHNPATVILEGNHKNLPSCRRDGPSVNGAQVPPRTSHPLVPSDMVHVSPHVTYSAVNSTSQPPPPQYTGGNNGSNQPQPQPGDNVPYSPAGAAAFMPHGHFPALRSTGSIFPSFAPSSYMRPTFPFSPNGELVYQYHGPQTPPPPQALFPTPMVTYSTVVPPPKLSCYNCGSQSHHASDCKDPTMEEMTKPGQYRLDYVPYQKPGDCSTEK